MISVDELMTKDVITLQPEDSILRGMSLMAEYSIRIYLPSRRAAPQAQIVSPHESRGRIDVNL